MLGLESRSNARQTELKSSNKPDNKFLAAKNSSSPDKNTGGKNDLTSKGVKGFTIYNRGEQVVGGAVGVGALAFGALPLAAVMGVWVGWNEFQIRAAKSLNERRLRNKEKQNAKLQEKVIYQASKNLKQKDFALAA